MARGSELLCGSPSRSVTSSLLKHTHSFFLVVLLPPLFSLHFLASFSPHPSPTTTFSNMTCLPVLFLLSWLNRLTNIFIKKKKTNPYFCNSQVTFGDLCYNPLSLGFNFLLLISLCHVIQRGWRHRSVPHTLTVPTTWHHSVQTTNRGVQERRGVDEAGKWTEMSAHTCSCHCVSYSLSFLVMALLCFELFVLTVRVVVRLVMLHIHKKKKTPEKTRWIYFKMIISETLILFMQ